ncbi:MAG: type II toxin-antitoxin system HipA family toxin [Bacteroidetes bacterium HGW-Bacteroidetes-11]|jgi:serine/threonine-protein kinase HipA|nr:MAG: type II toxin-antitoxin system HipA family toxin [Bacteroidetes bacterium HGW-Bacteroidetes-11]
MNRCPISYEFCGDDLYSAKGMRMLSPSLRGLSLLKYSAEELRTEAYLRAAKMSIQGVQPKLSAVLNIKMGCFDIVDKYGRYILKPQHHIFAELPQNEDLTMRLAETIGITVPLHGMVYSKDHTLTYFIKRFDRKGQKDKVAVEDFAQLAGMNRETKYNYTMEKLLKLIDEYCTFPAIEKARLFKLVIFNFLTGNEDMHLKNFSVIVQNGKTELSPGYDLLNSTIVLKGNAEEIALSISGKKRNLNADLLINYFGKERCSLPDKVIDNILNTFITQLPHWPQMIENSFLSFEMQEKYKKLLEKRMKVLGV